MYIPTQLSAKHSRIISIWNSGQGVVSLHIFHHTTAEEAFTREACMIDAIGESCAQIIVGNLLIV